MTQSPPKSKTLVIHGFGTRPKSKYFFKPKGEDAGLGSKIFREIIQRQSGNIFFWGIDWEIKNEWNPLEIKKDLEKLYFAEKEKAGSPENLKKLKNFIEKNQIKTIIGHSMGCFMIAKYLENYEAAKSLEKIIFTQADLENTWDLDQNNQINKDNRNKFVNKEIELINVFMKYDNALLYSKFLNKYKPSGISEMENNFTNNIEFSHSFKEITTEIFAGKTNIHEKVLENDRYFEIILKNLYTEIEKKID